MPISFQVDSEAAKKPASIPSCEALGGVPQNFENLLEQILRICWKQSYHYPNPGELLKLSHLGSPKVL